MDGRGRGFWLGSGLLLALLTTGMMVTMNRCGPDAPRASGPAGRGSDSPVASAARVEPGAVTPAPKTAPPATSLTRSLDPEPATPSTAAAQSVSPLAPPIITPAVAIATAPAVVPVPRDGGPDGDLPIPPPPTAAVPANPVAALPDGGTSDGGGPAATGTSTDDPTRDDWQDTVDRHPVANHAITHSSFDDEDRQDEHPTGP